MNTVVGLCVTIPKPRLRRGDCTAVRHGTRRFTDPGAGLPRGVLEEGKGNSNKHAAPRCRVVDAPGGGPAHELAKTVEPVPAGWLLYGYIALDHCAQPFVPGGVPRPSKVL